LTTSQRVWLGGLSLLLVATSGAVRAQVSPEQATLNRYCASCHNDKLKSGGLSLSAMSIADLNGNTDEWEKVARKLRGRAMPPIGRPRPDETTYDALVNHLETALDRIATTAPHPGRTETFRRLTRTEYRNAIRDLFALDVDVSSLLPADDSSFGFDNVTVGNLSPMLMEKYLASAQKVSRLAVGTAVRAPTTYTVNVPVDLTQEDHLASMPLGTRGGTSFAYTFPLDATYEFQVRLYRDRNEHVEGLGMTGSYDLELTLDGERVKIFTVKPVARTPHVGGGYEIEYDDASVDKGFNIRMPVKAGAHQIAAAFLKTPTVVLETERQPYPVAFNLDRHPRTQPAVYSVAITGPFDATGAGDTPSRKRIFTCRPSTPQQETACARTIVSAFARRAYRRPATDDDLKTPLKFYEDGRADGGFENGIQLALQKILLSPEFLFKIERDPVRATMDDRRWTIDDLQLASRLSFFLWSSIPDDELLDIAARGKLRDPKVLEKQVRRMLSDERSASLVNNFAEQWLYLRNLSAIVPDSRKFTTFDDNLRKAFRHETELFFESVMKEDRSVLDLLRANYTFVDERLAKFYGIPDVYGTQFRRIALSDDSVRGGLLGQGSILLATSYANRTSPVLRGKWVLENILGTPPPAPPPGVPPLKEARSEDRVPTMRERMAQHRDNPACSSCHMLMDPIGLSLENFDAIGRWRTKGEDGAPVDAAGGLPSGDNFEGVKGLKQALLKHPDLFVRTVTEKLMTYALGRGIEPYDGPAVRAILRDAQTDDYRFSTLVMSIVKSTPFQMRSSE
jgi:hypothetical protein